MKKAISLRDTLIYWLGRMGARSVSFLLLPLYTSFIAPAEWGRFNLLLITGDLLALAVVAQLPVALYRYWAFSESEQDKRRLSGAAFTTPLLLSTLVFLPVYAWADAAASVIGLAGYGWYLRVLLLTQQLNVLLLVVQAEMRLRDETKLYAVLEIVQNFGQAAVSVFFVGVVHWGVWGILLGQLLVFATVAAFLVPRFLRRTHLNLDRRLLRSMLAFSLPLIPSALAMAGVHNVDRFFLQYLRGPAEVGVYSLGYKLGLIVNMVLLGPFLLIWEPKSFELARSPRASGAFANIFSLYLGAALFMMIGLAGAAREIVTVMAAPEYREAWKVIPLVGFSYVLFGMDAIVRVGLLAHKRTKTVLVIVLAACAVNVVLNVALIPRMGMIGAGWATLLAFITLFTLDLFLSQRYLPIAWEWKRLSIMGAATVATLAGMYAVQGLALWVTIGIKLLILAAFPLVLLVAGFFSRQQLSSLFARARTS